MSLYGVINELTHCGLPTLQIFILTGPGNGMAGSLIHNSLRPSDAYMRQ